MKKDLIILFCRYPVPDLTKTRLVPALGPIGAAELHHKLVLMVLNNIDRAAKRYGYDIEVCFDGTSLKKVSQWLGASLSYSMQRGEDLGEKMSFAFHDAFDKGYQGVVLIGTDIPDLKSRHLRKAFNILRSKDLVLGPSKDGGYWLVGMKKYANIFRVNEWGGRNVLEQTIELARRDGFSFGLLEYLSDIDTIADLKKWKPDEDWEKPYLSVIIPALNEAATIKSTIDKASHPEVEIIVVDGGSRDDTSGIAGAVGAKIIKSSPGRALQLNRGAEEAKADVLLFLHADTLLPEGYPFLIFDGLLDKSVSGGAFRFKTDMDNLFIRMIELFTNLRSTYLRLPYGDQAFFIPKHVFQRIGGFPIVPVAEDLLFMRLLSKTGKILILPANIVTSARRWREEGVFRTSFKHQVISVGILMGVAPEKLGKLRR